MPNHNTNDKGEKGVPVTAHYIGTGMDMRGDPQACSRDFSGISPLCHHHVRSTSRTTPTGKTERQKSASRHPCLSEDNAPHTTVQHRCPLAQFPHVVVSGCIFFSLSVLVKTPSLQGTTSSALQKCSPQQWWPGRTFLRAASGTYFLSTSSTSQPLGKRKAGLVAPEERKCRWSLGGWD